ncbi:copper chaperone PCu(A)C [Vibrio agarivorans]|uniref:copper chaperone PCu(A)C n=1 Tax=Vibrio agarivorans TaxID=153622 RepID=UPI00222FC43F|nr:copper chaperone PCu(A)C [Vibrio agarivorans]MDN3660886.1 copper chaperone PCu(A)C [Vibrio agarivorans]
MHALAKTLALFVLTSSFAQAHYSIEVQDAYARATPPSVTTSAVFATLHNHSDKEVVVMSASTERAGKVELHTVEMEGDVMKMRQVPNFTIAAQQQLHLKPGADHIMLFNLDSPLKEGEVLSVELSLKEGDTLQFDAPVKKVMQGMKHHHH